MRSNFKRFISKEQKLITIIDCGKSNLIRCRLRLHKFIQRLNSLKNIIHPRGGRSFSDNILVHCLLIIWNARRISRAHKQYVTKSNLRSCCLRWNKLNLIAIPWFHLMHNKRLRYRSNKFLKLVSFFTVFTILNVSHVKNKDLPPKLNFHL